MSILHYKDYINQTINLLHTTSNKDLIEGLQMPSYRGDETPYLTVRRCPEPLEFIHEFDDISNDQKACDEKFKQMLKTFDVTRIDKDSKGLWFNKTLKGINLRPGYLNDIEDQPIAVRLGDDCVHGRAVGRTGSGKSVFLNALLCNLLVEYAPWELEIYLADFKKVELSRYVTKHKTPHVKVCAATSEIRYVVSLLQHINDCMCERQNFFARLGIQKLEDFRKKYGRDGKDEDDKKKEKGQGNPDRDTTYDEHYISLPRVFILVDEFQQLFQEATSKEAAAIKDILLSITKLGRATGFHLLFASQEMAGTLDPKVFANFKLNMALPCDANVSSMIIGNNAAAKLNEKGKVIINIKSGDVEDNMKFKVPYLEGDDVFFDEFLEEIVKAEENSGWKTTTEFYQENYTEDINYLTGMLNREEIRERKQTKLLGLPEYWDAFILGPPVEYKAKSEYFETVFFQRGRKKNIAILCNNPDDIAYLMKLLAINFAHSTKVSQYKHVYIDLNPLVTQKYNITDDLPGIEIYKDLDLTKELAIMKDRMNILALLGKHTSLLKILEEFIATPEMTEMIKKILQNLNSKIDSKVIVREALKCFEDVHRDSAMNKLEEFIQENQTLVKVSILNERMLVLFDTMVIGPYNKSKDSENKEPLPEYVNANTLSEALNKFILTSKYQLVVGKLTSQDVSQDLVKIATDNIISYFKDASDQDIQEKKAELSTRYIEERELVLVKEWILPKLREVINAYQLYDPITNPIPFEFRVVWLNGVDYPESIQLKPLEACLLNSIDVNVVFIMTAGMDTEPKVSDAFRSTEYLFINVQEEKIYNKYGIGYTKKDRNSLVIDFKIKSLSCQRSFKKFRHKTQKVEVPELF